MLMIVEFENMIRSLPLFESVNGELISIENDKKVGIISSRIPPDGMKEIAEATNTTFAMCNTKYSNLLKLLSSSYEIDRLYAEIIVPNFQAISYAHRLKHLEYIRDHVCRDVTESSGYTEQIFRNLMDIQLIRMGNQDRRVNEFYSHRNNIFVEMLTEDEFLPKHFRTNVWKRFIEALGLITHPTQQQVLEFAKCIAHESANARMNINDLQKKSSVLTSFILAAEDNFFSENVLQELKNIKFVISHAVDVDKRAIYNSFIKPNGFICFNGSTTHTWEDICWSSTPLLYSALTIRSDKRRQELGVLKYPSVERVIVHSHNVTEVFHKDFIRKTTQTRDNVKYITKLYDFLKDHLDSPELNRLRNSYFVLIPNEAMIKADMVFESSSFKNTEIKPYLYKLPKSLRKYIDLFETLGAMNQPCRSQCIKVLESIKNDFNDQTLPPRLLKKVAQTITLLFKLDGSPRDNELKLFLPNKEMKLRESSSLTVCDNKTYADILKGVADIDYVLGFKEMEIMELTDTDAMFRTLPDSMQPSFLSEVVVESVFIDSIETVHSPVSCDWQCFVRSESLINGIIRLIRDQCGLGHKGQPTTDLEYRSRNKLRNIRIKEVNGLVATVSYKGSVLDGIRLQRTCYLKDINCANGISSFELYFDFQGASDETMILSEEDGIFDLVQKCTEHTLDKDRCIILGALLNYRKTPEKIPELLDRRRVAQIDFKPSSVFPKPGTYVNREFYPFLLQEIVPFKAHEFEFVAMEVEYEDDENNAFIYVHIISQIPKFAGSSIIALRYTVNAGETRGFIEAPIFKLYRFVSPNSQNTNREVELYDLQHIITLPLDENRQRVRELLTAAFQMIETERKILIKRQLLRWHPDRNPGLEDYAKEIFDFIKKLIVELEENEHAMRSSGTFSSIQGLNAKVECSLKNFTKENDITMRISPVVIILAAAMSTFPSQTSEKRNDGYAKRKRTFTSRVACEKALKAARFSRDANRCPRWSHNLCSIADGIEIDDIKEKVRLFESRLNISDRQYFRLRYPDAVEMNKLPSDVFSLDDAAFAKETAHEIIAFVEDYI
ncbi:SACS-like protein [Mya arenaria]|uniref:SACS-like protein n=1 Tax=Mya arenaria TaxID=6604 RepID=A0ABY7EMA9_MYAAR|nr:SACS-like protein [Mya arenaria]